MQVKNIKKNLYFFEKLSPQSKLLCKYSKEYIDASTRKVNQIGRKGIDLIVTGSQKATSQLIVVGQRVVNRTTLLCAFYGVCFFVSYQSLKSLSENFYLKRILQENEFLIKNIDNLSSRLFKSMEILHTLKMHEFFPNFSNESFIEKNWTDTTRNFSKKHSELNNKIFFYYVSLVVALVTPFFVYQNSKIKTSDQNSNRSVDNSSSIKKKFKKINFYDVGSKLLMVYIIYLAFKLWNKEDLSMTINSEEEVLKNLTKTQKKYITEIEGIEKLCYETWTGTYLLKKTSQIK